MNMKKNFCIILGVLLSFCMFSACSNSDESTENKIRNSIPTIG